MTVRLPVLQPELTREQRRSRRHREVRSHTISVKRMTKRERWAMRALVPEADQPYWRPATRSDCIDGPRPCPYVACPHNLYLDVKSDGAIKLNFPDLEPDQLENSCALDVAALGGVPLEVAGQIMNLTRERIRQLEVRAFRKILLAAPELYEVLVAYLEVASETTSMTKAVL